MRNSVNSPGQNDRVRLVDDLDAAAVFDDRVRVDLGVIVPHERRGGVIVFRQRFRQDVPGKRQQQQREEGRQDRQDEDDQVIDGKLVRQLSAHRAAPVLCSL
jgi:hypothetical protein